jgi:4-hydroxybenzoyl-CoA thioesterase
VAFKIARTVLFGDCDPAGAIYTPRIAYFVVEATHEFFADLLGGPGVRTLLGMGILPPARALDIEFLSPLVWDDRLEIEVTAQELQVHSFSLLIVGRKTSGVVAFRSTFAQVCVSPETLRPVEVPGPLRLALSKALHEKSREA